MLRISYAGCPRPSSAISVQFTLEMCDAVENRPKFTKNPYFQNSRSFKPSRSSTLTPIKSLLLLLVMISSMSVPICNRFHATRANSGKQLLRGSRLWRPPAPASLNLGGRDLDCWNLRLGPMLKISGYFGLSPAISSQFSVTDRQTDAQAMVRRA